MKNKFLTYKCYEGLNFFEKIENLFEKIENFLACLDIIHAIRREYI